MNDLIFLLVLLVLSGFFSGSETALTSISMVRVNSFLKKGRSGARSLYWLKSNTNRMLISILIGNNLVNIGASAMATVIATEKFGHLGPGIAVGALTIIILIFGEITPKTFAVRYASPISLFVAPPLMLFTRLVLPIVWILDQLIVFLQSLSKAKTDPTVTETELISMVEHGAQEGTIERNAQQLIERIFAFNELRARDVMIPWQDVFTLDSNLPLKEALPEIVAHPYNRIPLRSGKSGNVKRVTNLREILKEIVKADTCKVKKPLKKVHHDSPLFVPINQPIVKLFPILRRDEQRVVMVVDEYGALQGMFTLKDMLEELVGEIHDEMRETEHLVQEIKKGELLVNGTEEIRAVQDYLDVDLSGKPTDSVNRWILRYTESIPKTGDQFIIDELEILVEKASKRCIQQVRIRRPNPQIVEDKLEELEILEELLPAREQSAV